MLRIYLQYFIAWTFIGEIFFNHSDFFSDVLYFFEFLRVFWNKKFVDCFLFDKVYFFKPTFPRFFFLS